jgi:AhpD family alkylhydroperoxidase
MSTEPARVTPGTSTEIGRANTAITWLLGAATGGPPPNLFTTLARHRRLFRPWLRFAGGLMPGGTLPRDESELVILRVAHLTDCAYEWHHHERLGARAGLSAEEITRVRAGAEAPGWTPRRKLLLDAVDELHRDGRIGDELWARLSVQWTDTELIELCLLTGHYIMLAMTINSLGIQLDPVADPQARRSAAVRIVQTIAARRGA